MVRSKANLRPKLNLLPTILCTGFKLLTPTVLLALGLSVAISTAQSHSPGELRDLPAISADLVSPFVTVSASSASATRNAPRGTEASPPPPNSPAQNAEKKLKNRDLIWNPPKVDSPVRSVSPSPPCVLPDVLEQAAASTSELITDLQNFSAQERIQYQTKDVQNFVKDASSGTFDYVVIFHHEPGEPIIEESRKPAHGSTLFPAAAESRGLPEMVLMFLTNMQGDYEMKCEGAAEWEGQHAWVIHFQQRPDKPGRTFSFSTLEGTHPANLKGHAWIAADSGQVVHLETGLMEGIPAAGIRQWYLSIDYAPVRFRTKDVSVWLPQIADSYYDYGYEREIVYHTFTDFLLFSVQTDQKVGKPQQP